jgi:hypothetical protein
MLFSVTMSGMKNSRNVSRFDGGEINVLLIPLILLILLFLGAGYFGFWAFTQRQDYKNNSDKKVAAAVSDAKKAEDIIKDQAFAQAEKNPLTSYEGPSDFGSVHVSFPKTWSVYVGSHGTQPLDAYFNPQVVPSTTDYTSVFSLRVQVLQQQYSDVVRNLNSYVQSKQITMTPYSFAKVPSVVGVRSDGLIQPGKKNIGSMIIVPLRDKTLEVWTENQQSEADFNGIILPNFSFEP